MLVICDDGYQRIFYRLEGELAADDACYDAAQRDNDGGRWRLMTLMQAQELIRLMPVLRLRDARFMRRIRNGTVPPVPDVEITASARLPSPRELVNQPQNLSDGQIRQGLAAMGQLLEHYFSEQGSGACDPALNAPSFA